MPTARSRLFLTGTGAAIKEPITSQFISIEFITMQATGFSSRPESFWGPSPAAECSQV